MREILFRGKRLDNDEWVESGSLLRTKNEETGEIIIFLGSAKPAVYIFNTEKDVVSVTSLGECIYYRVDPDTIGQYAGLCDKNGKKIFEGDILRRYSDYCEAYFSEGVVKYGKFNCGCCDGVYGWYLEGGDIRNLDDAAHMGIEICGNIHDNPELLEGEE